MNNVIAVDFQRRAREKRTVKIAEIPGYEIPIDDESAPLHLRGVVDRELEKAAFHEELVELLAMASPFIVTQVAHADESVRDEASRLLTDIEDILSRIDKLDNDL